MKYPLVGCGLLLASLAVCLSSFSTAHAKGPTIGEAAPDFKLGIVGQDESLSLGQGTADGPVVVVVLRGFPGYQCPLCSEQVGALVNRASALEKLAKHVILVYPGAPSNLEKHAEDFMGSRTLPSPMILVRDPDMKMVTDYGVRWKAPRETAYPATFVIDKHGIVRWSKISETHAGRTTAQEIIDQLNKL